MVDIVILVLSVLVSLATGLFVYARNPGHIVNRIYALLTVSLISLSVSNYFSLQTDDRLWFIRIVVFFTVITVASLYYMVLLLDRQGSALKSWQRFGVYATAVVALLTLTPVVFSGLQAGPNPSPVPGPGAALFAIQFVFFLTASLVLLVKRVTHSRGVQKLQYLYMLAGISPMFLLAPFTSFLMPVVFKNPSLVFLSPLYGMIFVAFIGYAIVKHRLFDIKLIIARSLAYVAAVVALSGLYGFLFFGAAELIFDLQLPVSVEIMLSVATGIAALAFQRLKSVFDKISNRLFYRDAYDPQEFFDHFNKALVSTIDLHRLLQTTTETIETYMKTQFCLAIVHDHGKSEGQIIGANGKNFSPEAIKKIRHALSKNDNQIIVADDPLLDDEHLHRLMVAEGLSIIVRLVKQAKDTGPEIGFLVLGPKKSGNIYAPQDIVVLTTVANELIIAIQNAFRFEEIQEFNVTLRQRIDDATRKLRHTNDKLRQLDQTKDDFISMASHQLRTPLTSVKGYVSMVLEGDAGKVTPLQRKLLNQSFVSAQRMVYLISDLLNVSRLRTGKFVIEPVPSNLAKVIKDEIDQLQETAKGRGLELTYNRPERFPTLMLDETKIRQVIMNFIDNAIYYTPTGGHIAVSLVDKQDTVEFTVTDDGIGVPGHEQHHLFTKFFRAHNARRARPDGTGLGLFMAKKVVVSQGGAVIFRSKEGRGSTFGFSFAKEKLQPLPPEGE